MNPLSRTQRTIQREIRKAVAPFVPLVNTLEQAPTALPELWPDSFLRSEVLRAIEAAGYRPDGFGGYEL